MPSKPGFESDREIGAYVAKRIYEDGKSPKQVGKELEERGVPVFKALECVRRAEKHMIALKARGIRPKPKPWWRFWS